MQLERFPAAEDSDGATLQTVELMCRYIRESADDDMLQRAAAWLHQSMGGGSDDPAMKAWAVFWFLKHFVRFVVDEAPMFRLGEPNQQDLLYSPAVLIRMQDPAGDCDDFTMLGAALLKCLSVPFNIVTIAASPDDPTRWSHVFLMALLPSGPLPLDASHGSGPGWMVPAAHTFRWQAWDETGRQVDTQRPRKHSLNGWVRTGMGQIDVSSLPSDLGSSSSALDLSNVTIPPDTSSGYVNPANYTPWLASGMPSAASTGTSAPFNIQSFLSGLVNAAAGTTNAVVNAQTQQQLAQASMYNTAALTNLIPLGLAAIAAWLVISMIESRK